MVFGISQSSAGAWSARLAGRSAGLGARGPYVVPRAFSGPTDCSPRCPTSRYVIADSRPTLPRASCSSATRGSRADSPSHGCWRTPVSTRPGSRSSCADPGDPERAAPWRARRCPGASRRGTAIPALGSTVGRGHEPPSHHGYDQSRTQLGWRPRHSAIESLTSTSPLTSGANTASASPAGSSKTSCPDRLTPGQRRRWEPDPVLRTCVLLGVAPMRWKRRLGGPSTS